MEQVMVISGGLLLCAALVTDLTAGKIPNDLTLAFAVFGLFLNMALSGFIPGGAAALKGMATGILLTAFPYLAGYTGAGDVKLFGALGAVMGAWAVLWIFLYASVCGGIVCLGCLLRVRITMHGKTPLFSTGRSRSRTLEPVPATIAYTGPVAAGYLAFGLLGGGI